VGGGDIGWVICASDPSVRVGKRACVHVCVCVCGVSSVRARTSHVKWCTVTPHPTRDEYTRLKIINNTKKKNLPNSDKFQYVRRDAGGWSFNRHKDGSTSYPRTVCLFNVQKCILSDGGGCGEGRSVHKRPL